MADIHCPRCGEPWETDCLHEEADARLRGEGSGPNLEKYKRGKAADSLATQRFYHVFADFKKRGCEAVGGRCSGTTAHPGISVLQDLLGDDVDGLAAMTEDLMGATLFDDLEE